MKNGEVLLDKYRLISPRGKGGDGIVWLAQHLVTLQLWIIKVIPKTIEGRGFQELEMMKRIHHAGLPLVVDVVEDMDSLYLVLEYIRGRTLEEEFQKKGRMTPTETAQTGCELCNIVGFLHRQKSPILHLDLKPANIMRKKDGSLVLVDFGSACKKTDQNPNRGTDGYAAPEQYQADQEVDERTDIYGIGAVLYYLVSGVRYSEKMKKSKVPGCSDRLGQVIHKCLEEDPKERYENCRQLKHELLKTLRQERREKRRYQMWAAIWFVILTLGLAKYGMNQEIQVTDDREWDYIQLLEEAMCCDGEEKLMFYKKALFLNSKDPAGYLQYMKEAVADGVFSFEEEDGLKELLHAIPLGKRETYEETLRKESPEYARVAATIGLAYWFDYEGENGRQIGCGWFEKAKKAGNENGADSQWTKIAQIFAGMAEFYQNAQKNDRLQQSEYLQSCWERLQTLLEEDFSEVLDPLMEDVLWKETEQQIPFFQEEWKKIGITDQQLQELKDRIGGKIKES